MSRPEPAKEATFTMPLAFTPNTGVAIEIPNPVGSGKRLRFKRFAGRIESSSTMTFKRRDEVYTGGTSTAGAPVPANIGDPASVVEGAKLYTVAPTGGGGNLLDTPLQVRWTSTHHSEPLYDDHCQELSIGPGESLIVEFGTSAALVGFLRWAEVNV